MRYRARRVLGRGNVGGSAAGWARRLGGHPVIAAALGAARVPASVARLICTWTGRLPAALRDAADRILVDAAAGGADVRDLAVLAQEMLERTRPHPAGTGMTGTGLRTAGCGWMSSAGPGACTAT